jgi:hypothetical protein
MVAMSQQRSEFGPEVEVPVLHESSGGHALTGDSLDRLLADRAPEHQNDEPAEPLPMAGIWLGVAIGVALWALMAGVVLLMRTG